MENGDKLVREIKGNTGDVFETLVLATKYSLNNICGTYFYYSELNKIF